VRSEQFSVWLGGGARQDTTSNLSLALRVSIVQAN
jgi:hypothetical protein